MATGYVISDLHMFARWSSPGNYVEQMHQAANEADFFILNGDIFDLRWSILPGIDATIDAAIDWLDKFASDHPNCTVYYILGNHDAFEGLGRRVDELSRQIENFQWRSAYLRMGSVLLTHGDLFWHAQRHPFERTLAPSALRITRLIGWAYHFVHTIQATRIFHALWPPQRCARHIEQSLAYAPKEMTDGITDIYCGHTHVAVSDFDHAGITFHNTGSGIKGLRCNMCKFSIPDGCEISQ
jgi:UDP-2,3-diacylglucosamine pyrophosphatase LpxH